ncbi:MAG: helix-turn-helix domain-containing protein [Acetatifactor sp.]
MTQIDKNIAVNLKRMRKARNMSLDMLAEQTGVSKSMLGQIERGESNPTVATIGKIVEGLKIPFEQLIYERPETVIMPSCENASVLKEQPGQYCVHILLPYHVGRSFEIYQGRLEPGAVMEGSLQGENLWEYLTVLSGELELEIDGKQYCVPEKKSFYFLCDRTHSYRCTGQAPVEIHMVVSRE